tara:strand:+ start:237 stop:1019 length:783 start_codon:yes stop_codon:yes gene_type:complete
MAEEITTFEEEAPESQEHIQEMIDKAERVQSVARDDGKPSWLPDKFESPEDMAEAYAQLEQKLSSRDTQQDTEVKSQPPTPTRSEQAEEIGDALTAQGIDFNRYAEEYGTNGSLSEESYTELAEKGLSKDVVNTWIKGEQAIADQTIRQAHESIGGKKEYDSLIEWASNSLDETEIDSFNRAIESPDVNDVVFAIKSLNARRSVSEGQSPTLLQGDTGGSKTGSFQSVAQLTKAMNDPRYQTDPAYRDEVTSKLSQSSIM